GQVTDALAGVEPAGAGEGVRRAGVQAGGAGAAVARLVRRVGLQIQVEQQGAEEEIAAAVLVDEHGVFADPAETGPAGEVALQERGGIDDPAADDSRELGTRPGEQSVETIAE